MVINNFFNPFSNHFQNSISEYQTLPKYRKALAVITGIIGGILTPFFLCSGSIALFQLSVKWMKNGEDSNADKVNQAAISSCVFSQNDERDPPQDIYDEDTIGNFSGTALLNFLNADLYEGDFIDGKMHGKGKFTFANGNVYEGNFIDGKIFGTVKFTFPNGDVYKGPLVGNKPETLIKSALLTYANGDVYTGHFKNGRMHGSGRLTYSNGDIYQGIFQNGLRHGSGKMTYENGDVFEGYFKNDILAAGKLTYSNNDRWKEYNGQFHSDGNFGGWGRLTFINDHIQRGWFVNGQYFRNSEIHKNYPQDVWG